MSTSLPAAEKKAARKKALKGWDPTFIKRNFFPYWRSVLGAQLSVSNGAADEKSMLHRPQFRNSVVSNESSSLNHNISFLGRIQQLSGTHESRRYSTAAFRMLTKWHVAVDNHRSAKYYAAHVFCGHLKKVANIHVTTKTLFKVMLSTLNYDEMQHAVCCIRLEPSTREMWTCVPACCTCTRFNVSLNTEQVKCVAKCHFSLSAISSTYIRVMILECYWATWQPEKLAKHHQNFCHVSIRYKLL
uniref:p0660F12.2 protein n=1 Tax=Oryza sativa subsp. japonica TaxID=39947 RepID=Q93WG0_ORYSJ|nr:P0660F12.2 [Oryza sativa Japonica Group]BAB63845.1 P0660F12.9 [Oryza sativa Japonica Group]